MAHNVSGSTYKFQKAYPEYFKELSDKEKEFAEFFVAMMNTTAQECTLTFSGGAATMLNGGRSPSRVSPNSPKRARSRKRASTLCSAKRGMIRALSTSSLQRSERIFRNRPFRSAGGLFFCPSRPVDIPAFGDNFFHNVEISVDNSPLSPIFVNFRAAPFPLPAHTQYFYPHSPHYSTSFHTPCPHAFHIPLSPENPSGPLFSARFVPFTPHFPHPRPLFHNSTATITTIIIYSIIYKKYLLWARSLSPQKAQTLQTPLIRANPPYFLPANRLS